MQQITTAQGLRLIPHQVAKHLIINNGHNTKYYYKSCTEEHAENDDEEVNYRRRRNKPKNRMKGGPLFFPPKLSQLLLGVYDVRLSHHLGPPYNSIVMIRFILVQNRQGKTRLAKWYVPYEDDEKAKLKGEVHRLIAPRDQKHQSNFVEFRNYKIVYRRYAGLFFCVCVDANDNELAYLEAIHFFVEVLDAFFGNVCELDLVFNFYKVYSILDEVFLAGEIEETSKNIVLTRLDHLDKLE